MAGMDQKDSGALIVDSCSARLVLLVLLLFPLFVGRPAGQVGIDSCLKHANVQPKAVFSYVMTVMDKISGWEDEEKWVGSKFGACMWIYTKRVLTYASSNRITCVDSISSCAKKKRKAIPGGTVIGPVIEVNVVRTLGQHGLEIKI